ncbi:hypothetical protein, partial [Salinicola salarius]|uniref:hypothetical protein n=1 Tax=Salinicola salarius TaxID=430457 RepID=UPI0026F24EA9
GVNEYFEPIFNAVWPSAGSFQTKPSVLSRHTAAPRSPSIDRGSGQKATSNEQRTKAQLDNNTKRNTP